MGKTFSPVAQARPVQEELPARVQEGLGELAAVAREGLRALSVGVGLGLAELMEEAATPSPTEEAGAAQGRAPVVPFAPAYGRR